MLRQMMLGCVVWLAAGACGGGSGGGGSPQAACEDAQASLCERLYTCYTDAELGALGFPSSEAACVTMLQGSEGCARQTQDNACTGNERYHADQADACVDQIAGLTCGQLRDEELDLDKAAPACGKVCAVD
jgi:hypothetical protein